MRLKFHTEIQDFQRSFTSMTRFGEIRGEICQLATAKKVKFLRILFNPWKNREDKLTDIQTTCISNAIDS